MLKNIFLLGRSLVFFGLITATAQAQSVRLTMPEIDRDELNQLLAGQEPLQVTSFNSTRRDIAILVLQMQALRLGGFDGDIIIATEKSHKRILTMVAQGKSDLAGMQFWQRELGPYEGNICYSDAIVREGEFYVGIYTAEHNKQALAARTRGDIVQLRGVSSRNWVNDWSVLQSLELKRLYNTLNWHSMVKMVDAGRADFTLSPFYATDDMSAVVNGYRIVPIPGVKVLLPGSQHWVVNCNTPAGIEIYNALQDGLAVLRRTGRVVRALTESGFFYEPSKDWQVINTPLSPL